jgi:hypothetical protein
MTTDEMVAEIQQLFTAVDYEGRIGRPVVVTVYADRCTARACSHAVDVPGGATAALTALRDQLREKASKALGEHEAKAETLRKALGIVEGPDAATCAQLDAVRRYIAARNAYEDGKMRPMGQKASRAYDELLDATATLRAVMGGAL